MADHLNLRIRRYLTAKEFASDLKQLKAFRGTFIGDSLLESLEKDGLVRPKVRLRWPDPVARRMWLEGHHYVGSMHEAVEPDGARWEAAVRLKHSLFRAGNRHVYGNVSHPFDDPEPAFAEFLQRPDDQTFHPHRDRQVSVANDRHPGPFFDSCNVQDYYSGWQVLAAAEVADMGIHVRLNMADPNIADAAHEAILQGRLPNGDTHELFAPARALKGFHEHEAALDAIIWSVEEADGALARILANQGGGRFKLEEQSRAYHEAREEAAHCGMERHNVRTPEIIAVCKFLAERWSDWDSEGRPLIAEAYKIFLAAAVRILQMTTDMTLAVAVEHVIRAMGDPSDQLYKMFKALWAEPTVATLLQSNEKLARQGRPASEWPAVKAEIEQLRSSGPAGAVVADLVMAHRLRGAVHHQLPEQDQFEMEKLFFVLLRAAAMTHAHVQRGKAAAVAPPSASPAAEPEPAEA